MLGSKKLSKYEKEKIKKQKELEEYNKKQEELDQKLKKEKQKHTFKSIISKLRFETYTKTLVAIVIFVSLVDLQLSYVLAFLGREQIAEDLSVQICTTILGTVLIYIVRAYFDTKAEKQDEKKTTTGETLKSKIDDITNYAKNKLNLEDPNDSEP